jgi:1-acyl-sn-glycerol-3-phosphate acyltransferase
MSFLRSILFNVGFYGLTTILCVLALPALLLPRGVLVWFGRIWACGTAWMLRRFCGIDYEVRGLTPPAPGGRVYAFKHQSAWDTIMLPILLNDPMIVMKRELLWLPIFGWYLRKTRQVAIDRSGGAAALKRMLRAADSGLGAGRPLVIFPEGTRMAPGARRPYHPGVAALYTHLRVPVVPVALNSGRLWGRRSFLKKPGRILVEFLPAIEPGLDRAQFTAELERRIEEACARLEEGVTR